MIVHFVIVEINQEVLADVRLNRLISERIDILIEDVRELGDKKFAGFPLSTLLVNIRLLSLPYDGTYQSDRIARAIYDVTDTYGSDYLRSKIHKVMDEKIRLGVFQY